MSWLRLSFDLKTDTPVWPGTPKLEFEPVSVIGPKPGECCYVYKFCVSNHSGTHIDGPLHFNEKGASVASFPPEHFVFERVLVLEVPCEPDQLITETDLQPVLKELKTADLLLLRTGFAEKVRASDPEAYVRHNPGLSAGAAHLLVNKCPELRAVGVDAVSISAFQHKREGVLTHQILCGRERNDGRAVLLLEDLNLAEAPAGFGTLQPVVVAPLFLPELDSAPCTVFARLTDAKQE